MLQLNDEYLRQRAAGDIVAGWDFRLVHPDGKVYTLPPGAVTSRSRAGRVDDGSWNLKLTLDLTRLPEGTDPLQYHGVEVYRLVAGVPEPIPYFTGVIDVPDDSSEYAEGAGEHERVLDCYGVLYKAKGYPMDSTYFTPTYASFGDGLTAQLTGICSIKRGSVNASIAAGASESLPGPVVAPYGINNGFIKVFKQPDYTDPYTYGSDYTIDAADVMDLKVVWAGGWGPVAHRFFEWVGVDRWQALKLLNTSYTIPKFLVLPYGRSPDDLYQTYITALENSGTRLVVEDPTPFLPGNNLLNLTQGEWVTVDVAGTQHIRKITSVTSDGKVNLDSAIPGAQGGDPVWLSTTDAYQAWDDNYFPEYFIEAMPWAMYRYGIDLFKSYPKLGMAVPLRPARWETVDGVYTTAKLIDEDDEMNSVEAATAGLLLSTGLYSPENVTWGYSGSFMRNAIWMHKTADEIMAEIKEQAMLPWVFAHDHQDGSVYIGPYQQKLVPDWTLTHVETLDEEPLPEPTTAVLVVAEGEERNVAKECYRSRYNSINPQALVDGRRDVLSEQGSYAFVGGDVSPHYVDFALPPISPPEAYPDISRIVVHAKGKLRASMDTGDGNEYHVDGVDWVQLGDTAGAPTAYEITKQALERLLPRALVSGTARLRLWLKDEPNGFAEVEVFTNVAGAWRAALTDDQGHSLNVAGAGSAQVLHHSVFNSYPITVEAWIKTTSTDNVYRAIVNKFIPTSWNGWHLSVYGGQVRAGYFKDASNYVDIQAYPIADGKWHHVAFVVEFSQARLYVDGELVASQSWTGFGDPCTTTQPLTLGGFPTQGNFVGDLHEVRIWNKARSQDAIRNFKSQRLTEQAQGLIGYWPMNEPSGTVAYDQSGGGRNATLTAGAAFTVTGDRRIQWAPADQGADKMGTVWRSPDQDRRESYRFAPTSLLQRISPKYWFRGSMRYRLYERRLEAISQLDCRNFAEDYQDEFLRVGKTYIATAPLDDRAELGDTVRVFHPRTGEELQLLLWALDDSGAPGDVDMARYELIDYGR